ncbi:MAG: 4Fe-4S dicluster domain-containing protein [Promethearchaeota archaeon]|nr:MAG: 4Fe-4S dicluster domain-containing protein [Candidatus Lokiarchaeota archaeon]
MVKKSRAPYLGKVALFWCDICQVPLLKSRSCQICGGSPRKVDISPPGDVRPAFDYDYTLLQDTVDHEYGEHLGKALFPRSQVVLLNRIGGLDRSEEVIVYGHVVGHLKYNPIAKSYHFRPRLIGGWMIAHVFSQNLAAGIRFRKSLWLNSDGASFFNQGKSVLAPGVDSFSPDIEINDYILILTHNILPSESATPSSQISQTPTSLQVPHIAKNSVSPQSQFLGIGVAKASSQEMEAMMKVNRGNLAKNRFYWKKSMISSKLPFPPQIGENSDVFSPLSDSFLVGTENSKKLSSDLTHKQIIQNLERVYQANLPIIQEEIASAIAFIHKTVRQQPHPIAVAYSGGKDSLGVLLLVYRALGPTFKIFFANTGLELPEVEENIQEVSKALGMSDKLLIRAAGDIFWDVVKDFGPPGRDYRYCCHSLKAQQITGLIHDLYDGNKVLSFLGQRQYESLNRAISKKVYVNSFIPLQIAATPIKNWISLLLWLFILHEPVVTPKGDRIEVPVTSLYFHGHERLGCYLCPASNLATFEILKQTHPALHAKWFSFLDSYASQYGLPPEWVEYGLWRFKKFPPQWMNVMKEQGIEFQFHNTTPNEDVDLKITKGFSPCLQSGYSVKGKFTQALDLVHILDYLPSLTRDFEYDEELNVISGSGVYKKFSYRFNLFSDGSVFFLSPQQDFDYAGWFQHFYTTIYRTLFCNQCKTCISVCPTQAIRIEGSQVAIDVSKCTTCRLCSSHCPLFQISKNMITKSFST